MKTPTKTKLYQCVECKANYAYRTNLRRHVREQHKDKESELAPFLYKYKFSANFRFTCSHCGRNFNQTKHINYHMKKHHPDKSVDDKIPDNQAKKKKCPFCDYRDSLRSKMISHFNKSHNIEVKQTEFELSKEDFPKWKESIEESSNARFVQECSQSMSSKNRIVRRYICHRSGDYISTGRGLRQLKKQGSCKMNAFCPASIKVSYEIDSSDCQIHYIETHVGHSTDLEHLTLTSDQRRSIAAKIESKIPFDQILDEFRDSSSSASHRIDLLSRKDLLNIRSSLRNTTGNVSSYFDWLNAIKTSKFIFYKPPKTVSKKVPNLKTDDLILILMNPVQLDLIKKSSHNAVICMDNWIKTDLRLEALLIVDNIGQGFPCAFLITNQSVLDPEILKVFFQCIKEWAGPINCSTFLTDVTDDYFSTWCEIMNSQPKNRFYCSWHTGRACRQKLGKVKDRDKEVIIYNELQLLLKQTDISTFQNGLNKFHTNLSSFNNIDESFSDFYNFFNTSLKSSFELWPQCFQINAGIDTGMHLEHLHNTICNIFESFTQPDEIINNLMRFCRDNLFSRLTLIGKDHFNRKLKNIYVRHQGSLKLPSSSVCEDERSGWNIKSSTGHQTYHIEEVNSNCKCQLLCSECQVCRHWYSCSCVDSTIKWNMCKHIHLLCRWRKEQKFIEETTESPCLNSASNDYLEAKIDDLPIVFEGLDEESLTIMAEMSEEMFRQKKQELAERFIAIINNISLLDELSVVEKLIVKTEMELKNLKNEP